MPNFICITCGTQFAEMDAPPEHCPICEDERQYVNHGGQQWTTLGELRRDHHNRTEGLEPNLLRTLSATALSPINLSSRTGGHRS